MHMGRCALHEGRWVSEMLPKGAKWIQKRAQKEPKGPKMEPRGAKREPRGAKWEPKGSQNRAQNSPPGRTQSAAERVGLGSVCGVSFQHAPFPAVHLIFAIFSFFLGGFHPGSLPFPPLSAVFWSPFGNFWSGLGVFFFCRCVFLERFWTFFDAFLTDVWGYFSMFFAYFFELCFCLHFARIYFKWMRTFKRLNLQKNSVFL